MKTTIVCPNKNDLAWEKLVELGDERLCYIAFFRNGEVIPDAATARQILKIKPEAGQKQTPSAVPVEARKTPRGGGPRSRARQQTRRALCK